MIALLLFCGIAAIVLFVVIALADPSSLLDDCDEADELAKRLHGSAAWHCGCRECSSRRKAFEQGGRHG